MAGAFAGAGCAGVSSGKERSRLRPEASRFAGGAGGGADAGGGFCCAHAAKLNPRSKHKYKYDRPGMPLFYRCQRDGLEAVLSSRTEVETDGQKSRPLKGEDLERPGWRSSPGEENLLSVDYSDEGLFCPVVVGVVAGCAVSPTVLVIRRTSTRRLSARPAAVLFVSSGLSLPSPIT